MSPKSLSDAVETHASNLPTSGWTRRAVILGTGGALFGGILVRSTSGVQASVTTEELVADGDEITSHDGSIDALPVEPTIGIAWEGLNSASSNPTLTITVATDGESDLSIYDESVTLDGTNGEKSLEIESVDLLDAGWAAETFEAPDDASTQETTVDVTVSLTGEDIDETVTDSFTVIVHNHPASVDVGGTIETEIESDEAV